MSKIFDKKQIGQAVACALATGILSGAAMAQAPTAPAKDRELVTDTRTTVVKSGFGLCWHSGFGPPPAAGPECDPNYVAYVAPPAPLAARPVPAPAPVMAPVETKAVAIAPETPRQPEPPPQLPAKRVRN
jgi:OOP family OmpA-OmpF porin